MEVKKITEGMTAPQVAEVIDSNFRGIKEETDAKLSELGSSVEPMIVYDVSGDIDITPYYIGSGLCVFGEKLGKLSLEHQNYSSYQYTNEGKNAVNVAVYLYNIAARENYRAYAVYDENGGIVLEGQFNGINGYRLITLRKGWSIMCSFLKSNIDYFVINPQFKTVTDLIPAPSPFVGLLPPSISNNEWFQLIAACFKNVRVEKTDDNASVDKIIIIKIRTFKNENTIYFEIYTGSYYQVYFRGLSQEFKPYEAVISDGITLKLDVRYDMRFKTMASDYVYENPLIRASTILGIDMSSLADNLIVKNDIKELGNATNKALSDISLIRSKAFSAANAGWIVGAYADSDSIFIRESIPDGGIEGTSVDVQILDYRRIKVSNILESSKIGNRYRGIYWKIFYGGNIEYLKECVLRVNKTRRFETFGIFAGLTDWGNTGSQGAIKFDDIVGVHDINAYELLTDFKNTYPNNWGSTFGYKNYFYIALLDYNFKGNVRPYSDEISIDLIPNSTRVVATELTEELKKQIEGIAVKEDVIQVTNWGDSLTAGAGSYKHRHQETFLNALKAKGFETDLTASSNITYSIMMQKLLGNKYNVTNCGVGGETINTIAARLGANVVYANEAFVLPKDTSAVQIGNQSSKLKSAWDSIVSPLLQGAGNSVNPCYVQGIECTLKWTGSNYADTAGLYTIQRNSDGDRAINFSAKTPIILGGSKLYRNTEIAVLWCWQNGGYSNNDDLIAKLDKMIEHLNTKNYVIVGLHTGNAASRAEQEELLASKYGDKFFNWREYVSSNALYDFGITPTTDNDLTESQIAGGVISDEASMNEGSLPMSLWNSYIGDDLGATSNDKIHLTAVGYGILGYKLVERFRNLGYID